MKNIIIEKKSKLGIFVLLLFILQNNLVVNAATTFQKTYGGASDEYGYATEQLSDGGYIMCGRTISFGVGGYDNYLIRLNANGDTLWTKTYGNTGYDEAQSIKQTSFIKGPRRRRHLRHLSLSLCYSSSLLRLLLSSPPCRHHCRPPSLPLPLPHLHLLLYRLLPPVYLQSDRRYPRI